MPEARASCRRSWPAAGRAGFALDARGTNVVAGGVARRSAPAGRRTSASSGSGTFQVESPGIRIGPPGAATRVGGAPEEQLGALGLVDPIVESPPRLPDARVSLRSVGHPAGPHLLRADRRQQRARRRQRRRPGAHGVDGCVRRSRPAARSWASERVEWMQRSRARDGDQRAPSTRTLQAVAPAVRTPRIRSRRARRRGTGAGRARASSTSSRALLGGAAVTGDQADAAHAAEVAVDERVAGLGLRRRPPSVSLRCHVRTAPGSG